MKWVIDPEETPCDGFSAENAWGPCDNCGNKLEGHASEPVEPQCECPALTCEIHGG